MFTGIYNLQLKLRAILLLLLIFMTVATSYATHNRAGEIRFEQTGPLTIRVTVATYTRASSVDADRDSLIVFWGDGTFSIIGRSNGNGLGEVLPNDIKYNTYTGEHTYSGRGTYTLRMTDPNRIGGILNVDPPNSIQIPFHLETTFTLLNSQFEGYNSSVILLQPPIDNACVGQPFIHIPSAYDPDGDSIAYELTVPMQGEDTEVPNYSLPDQIVPGPENVISFDEETGTFIWDSPQLAGEYNIAFYIKEYRDGKLITKTMRDMQILVENCDNRPPEFDLPEEICLIAGEKVNIPITVTDPDIPLQKIRVEATGGPIIKGAYLDIDNHYHEQPIHTNLVWQTTCNDISKEYYTIVVKAEDNGIEAGGPGREPRGLSTLKVIRIKVIGPPPENEEADIEQNNVTLSWDSPYTCEVTENEYFRGFTIWKSEGSRQGEIDTCQFDMETLGYQPIAFNVMDQSNGRYTYTDRATNPGSTYCYRITAEFALSTSAGNPYNIVESLPTDEICIVLNRDLPAITNVSVLHTDNNNGKIFIRWLKPDAETLDTLENPGPYAFSIHRSLGIGTETFTEIPGSMTSFSSFGALNDTTFIDSLINTETSPYTYRIALYTDGNSEAPYGYSAPASSIQLAVSSTDRTNLLHWDFSVPWYNFQYRIGRLNNLSGQYEIIDSTEQRSYVDNDLINGEEYCYIIEAKGSYGIESMIDTLYNLSQEKCGIPIDTLAPCTPEFTINNVCNRGNDFQYDELINEITWKFTRLCERAPDFDKINIYFNSDSSADFTLIGEVSVDDDAFTHSPGNGLEGCYAFTAVDSVGNESDRTPIICVKNCSLYSLPNAFTPNGDGHNDIFGPIENRFVEKIEFLVFNRWGNEVFRTDDPEINWDGMDQTGKKLSPGTYFYICRVYGFDDSTQPWNILKGSIEIIY